MKKIRLDKWLVEKGFFQTREKAKREIMVGHVQLDRTVCSKPGEQIKVDYNSEKVTITATEDSFVSRGGNKLQKALEVFELSVSDKIFLDIGASTGGFTDCLLKNGAKKVYAIDVGYGQLDWSLRQSDKVVVMERTNFRHIDESIFCDEKVQGFVMDVSFISVTKLLEKIKKILQPQGEGVLLIKPQFEAGRDKVGKSGVVKDPKVHLDVLLKVVDFAANIDFPVIDINFSPIKGPKGNIEFLAHLKKNSTSNRSLNLQEIVKDAHKELQEIK